MLLVFREIGILDIIVKIINNFSQTYSPSSRGKSSTSLEFPFTLIESFPRIVDLLILLLQDPKNQTYFRHDINRAIYDCLSIENIQQDTFKVVKVCSPQLTKGFTRL